MDISFYFQYTRLIFKLGNNIGDFIKGGVSRWVNLASPNI